MRNIEIKAKVKQIQQLLQCATSLSNSSGTIIKQHDTFYKVNKGRLKLRKFENGQAELIYYERANEEGPKLSSYEKGTIQSDSVEGLNNVLLRAFGTSGEVKKERHLFIVGQTRVHVDKVEGLGDFMELEVVLKPEQTPEEGQQIALNLMESLGVEKEHLIADAYTDLINKM